MSRDIKLIAMDVDGTILGKNKRLSEGTKKAFKKAADRGIHLVIASGRAVEAVPEELLNLDGIEYAVTSNGSSVFCLTDGCRIYRKDLTVGQIGRLMTFYEYYDCPIEVFIEGRAYTSVDYYRTPEKFGASTASAEYVRETRHPVEDIYSFIQRHKDRIEGINFIVHNRDMKAGMRRKLENFQDFYVTSSVERYIEISHRDVCKRNALDWLAKRLDIGQENIAAFGDGENDLEMIQYAGIGVAMENGVEMLKKAADIIAPPCDSDGVARVIEEMLEEKI